MVLLKIKSKKCVYVCDVYESGEGTVTVFYSLEFDHFNLIRIRIRFAVFQDFDKLKWC